MEHEGVMFIKDWKPETEGAFALVCFVKGEWVRVASIDDEISAICKRQVAGVEIVSPCTGPVTRVGRAAARLQCKSLIAALEDIEMGMPSRNN